MPKAQSKHTKQYTELMFTDNTNTRISKRGGLKWDH